MSEEPRLVPPPDIVDKCLVHLPLLDKDPAHDDRLVLAEHDPLHAVVVRVSGGGVGEDLGGLLQRGCRLVAQPDVRLVGDDVDGDGREEAQRAVGEGQGVEEVLVGVLVGDDDTGVGHDQLVLDTGVVKEAVLVAGRLYPAAHHQAADGQLVQLRHHRQGEALGDQDPDNRNDNEDSDINDNDNDNTCSTSRW